MYAIPTIPPYAPYLTEVMSHPVVSGARLNTIMPLKQELKVELARLLSIMKGKQLWIDLKGRQLRTSYGRFYKGDDPEPARKYDINGVIYKLDPSKPKATGTLVTPPWAMITLDRRIKLDLSHGPVPCLFRDGTDRALIVEVIDGNKLIMLNGPKRVVGGGEGINIIHPSLEIEGYLTDLDKEYIKECKKLGIHTYMLSFVEQDSDVNDVLALDPEAIIAAKIESKKGLDWVKSSKLVKSGKVRLMAARGDLFIQLSAERPDLIVDAMHTIADADPTAIAASRLLSSLDKGAPNCADLFDIDSLLNMGYRTFMIGDDICFDGNVLLLALDMIGALINRHDKRQRSTQ